MIPLPPPAFLPRRQISEQEREQFLQRRDSLYALCTPAEQRCLIRLAKWYGAQAHELLKRPNILSRSYLADFEYRYRLGANTKPSLMVRSLAKISSKISDFEESLGQRVQRALIDRLEALLRQGDSDVLLGVLHFFRTLPLDVGFGGQRAFEAQLDALSSKCLSKTCGSALRRMETVVRCIRTYPSGDSSRNLSKHIWGLLLEVGQEDVEAGVRLIDEHWHTRKSPIVLSSIDLHRTPELAYQLAVKFKPHRPAFAADMLCASIAESSYQLAELDGSAVVALEQIMDGTCQLLASWIVDLPEANVATALHAMSTVHQYGNPVDAYWRKDALNILEIVRNLDHMEHPRQFALLAQLAFYADSGSSVEIEALASFQTCVTRAFGEILQWNARSAHIVRMASGALSILEDKSDSYRNRRIAANPEHPLLGVLEACLREVRERILVNEPQSALQNIVELSQELCNETTIRKYHGILREQFDSRARLFPIDGGLALRELIKYCGFSQADDHMYLKDLCQESFDMLLPILADISSVDAAVARTGIDWDPRHGYSGNADAG